jgi:acyl carrier protein
MRDRIKKVLTQVLKTKVDDTASQRTYPSWDSLRHLSLIVELEIEFGVTFEPEEMIKMEDIDIIEEIIKNKTII